jgi:hypothetical protein
LLSALVPGLRELRSPLACGLLWLLAAWLTIARDAPNPSDPQAPELVKQVWRLVEPLGVTGAVALLTFIAYLIGVTFSVQLVNLYKVLLWPAFKLINVMFAVLGLIKPLKPIFEGTKATFQETQDYSGLAGSLTAVRGSALLSLRYRLVLTVVTMRPIAWNLVRFAETFPNTAAAVLREDAHGDSSEPMSLTIEDINNNHASIAKDLRAGFPDAAKRLLLRQSPAYDAYDRLLTEAAFRYNLVAPLVALTFALYSYIPDIYSDLTLLDSFVLVLPTYFVLGALTLRGLQSTHSANDLLTVAILEDQSLHPVFFELERANNHLLVAEASDKKNKPATMASRIKARLTQLGIKDKHPDARQDVTSK